MGSGWYVAQHAGHAAAADAFHVQHAGHAAADAYEVQHAGHAAAAADGVAAWRNGADGDEWDAVDGKHANAYAYCKAAAARRAGWEWLAARRAGWEGWAARRAGWEGWER